MVADAASPASQSVPGLLATWAHAAWLRGCHSSACVVSRPGRSVAARDSGKGEAAAAKLRDEGLDAQFLRLDVTDKKDRAAASVFLEEKFGRLDILINNAGISAEAFGSGKVSTKIRRA